MFDQVSRSLIATPFQPVDIQAVGRRLKLSVRAREDGAKELPPTDAAQFAQAELDIIADIKAERNRCVEQLAGQLRAIQGALAQIDTHMNIAKVRQAKAERVADFRRIAHDVETEIAVKRGRAKEARLEFERFRGLHHLTRAPRDAPNRNRLWFWLVPLSLIEVMFNGIFLAAGSDQGLIGGMAIAIGLSVANVWMIGTLGGFLALRGARRREIWIKLPSILFFVVVLGVLAGLNLFVVHLRDMYATQDVTPDPGAMVADLLNRPLHFASIESLLLFALGLGCGALAIWKIHGNDDPYPGYGATHRRLLKAEADHANARRDLLDDATEVRDALLADLRRAMDQMTSYAQQRTNALASRARYVTLYEAHEGELEQAARRLLAAYREANVEARRTPAPAHFRSVFAFPDQGIRHPSIVALLTDPAPPPDAVELRQELESLRDSGLEAYYRVIEMLPPEAS